MTQYNEIKMGHGGGEAAWEYQVNEGIQNQYLWHENRIKRDAIQE